jgi:hypothetical protein
MSTCSACSKEISLGSEILAGDKVFHFDCFKCTDCHVFLSGKAFTVKDGKCYCDADFIKKFSPKCVKCGEFVVKDNVEMNGENYHNTCLVCEACNQPFPDGRIQVYQEKYYCLKDYQKITGTEHAAEEKAKVAERLEKMKQKIAEKKKESVKRLPVKEVYTLDELKNVGMLPDELDKNTREFLLSEEEFHHVFKMDKEAFKNEKKWKQDKLKKDAGLF